MADRFRILMVLDHPFPPDARVENEAQSLREAGFEVGLLSIAPDDRPDDETVDGVRIFRDRLGKEIRNKLRGLEGTIPLYRHYLAHRIAAVHARWPFDALHLHDLYLFGGGLKAGRRLGVPVVGDLHENWVEALKHYAWSTRFPGSLVVSIPRWERLERAWVNAVDRLVVVIDEAAERNRTLGVPEDRIVVVPNTIKLDVFDAFGTDEALVERLKSGFTITYTGGMDVHRGLASVIDGMAIIHAARPEARLVLVGDGRIRPELEAQAQALGLGEVVRFEGWQPQERIKSYILGSDLCIVPHLKTAHTDATIPHKLFHYMYFGRPVAVSSCRPLERIVTASGAGVVYAAGDARAFADAALRVAADPEEAAAMGRRGRAAVLDRYHWNATVQSLVAAYRELADARA